MTVASRIARATAATCSPRVGHGEPCTLYQSGVRGTGQSVLAVMERLPDEIGSLNAWEMTVTASVVRSTLTRAPAQGDILEESSGHRWIVDGWQDVDGMAVMTLREDPRQ